jgi:hypothetical protein
MKPDQVKNMIEQARERALESLALEQDDKIEHQFNYQMALKTFKAYKQWYCKRNQTKNYIRLYAHMYDRERPYSWNCRLQVFIKGKFAYDTRITAEAYLALALNSACEWSPVSEDKDVEYRIYKPNPQAK